METTKKNQSAIATPPLSKVTLLLTADEMETFERFLMFHSPDNLNEDLMTIMIYCLNSVDSDSGSHLERGNQLSLIHLMIKLGKILLTKNSITTNN